jgi:urease accessory protein
MATGVNAIPAGDGLIHIRVLPPSQLSLVALNFKYPLKLISPAASHHAKCLTVFILSYGGGLVSGDAVNLKVIVEQKAKLCLQTQGS